MKRWICREGRKCVCLCVFLSFLFLCSFQLTHMQEEKKGAKKKVKRIFPVSHPAPLWICFQSCLVRGADWCWEITQSFMPSPLTSSPWLWLQTKISVYFDRRSVCQFTIEKVSGMWRTNAMKCILNCNYDKIATFEILLELSFFAMLYTFSWN